jgi:hypothetical protein
MYPCVFEGLAGKVIEIPVPPNAGLLYLPVVKRFPIVPVLLQRSQVEFAIRILRYLRFDARRKFQQVVVKHAIADGQKVPV